MRSVHVIKKLGALLLAALMLFGAAQPVAVGYADEISNKKDELSDINNQLGDLNKDLKDGKAQASELQSEIKAAEKQIYSYQVELNSLQSQINSTKAKITQAMNELDQMQAEITKQNDDLNARLRTMYKDGDVGLFSVLLGSSSMSEFLTNMEMSKRIYDYDEQMLEQMQAEYAKILEKKQELQALKQSLLDQQAQADAKKSQLESDKAALSSKKSSIEKDNKALEKQIDDLNREANNLTAQILKLQGSGSYIGGGMLWPSASSTRITSKFGNRLHPILKVYKMHTGIDIGAASGTNILAANAGTVISAGYNSGYGYMVMIDHGGGIVTLYAHSSKLLVSKGDVVARGQVIALVGSTGNSTGPHLHFEVRVNGEYKNPLDYVSP